MHTVTAQPTVYRESQTLWGVLLVHLARFDCSSYNAVVYHFEEPAAVISVRPPCAIDAARA